MFRLLLIALFSLTSFSLVLGMCLVVFFFLFLPNYFVTGLILGCVWVRLGFCWLCWLLAFRVLF